MKVLYYTIFLILVALAPKISYAQDTEDPTLNVVNDIQFDLKSVKVENDSLIISIFAISYERKPREFRLNVFATNLISEQEEPTLFSTIQIGRVMVSLSERQNYLNYLLHQDLPVEIRLKVTPVTNSIKNSTQVKLVFSDLEEEGKFVEALIDLKPKNERLAD